MAVCATSFTFGWGGLLAVRHELDVGTLVAFVSYLGRFTAPEWAIEHSSQSDDRACLVRSRVRSARPAAHDPGQAGRRRHRARPGTHFLRARRVSLSGRLGSFACLARVRGRARSRAAKACVVGYQLHCGARTNRCSGGAFGRGQDDHHAACRAALRCAKRRNQDQRNRRPRCNARVAPRPDWCGQPGSSPVSRYDPREFAVRKTRSE